VRKSNVFRSFAVGGRRCRFDAGDSSSRQAAAITRSAVIPSIGVGAGFSATTAWLSAFHGCH